jgi:hypothetical protein
MVTAIAANARIIPIIEEIPILPVAFRNQTRETIPSRIAAIARMPVRITHERMLRSRLTKPSQFFERRGTAAGAGADAAVVTRGWAAAAAGTRAGCAAGEVTGI